MAKFSGFRTFKTGAEIKDVIAYLSQGLSMSLRELQAGLASLSFEDNFQSQIIEVSIPAGQTVGYSHNLGVIPSQRVILKSNGALLDDSDTPWTTKAVYFRNSGASDVAAKILLLR
jgi:hypothetical protein